MGKQIAKAVDQIKRNQNNHLPLALSKNISRKQETSITRLRIGQIGHTHITHQHLI